MSYFHSTENSCLLSALTYSIGTTYFQSTSPPLAQPVLHHLPVPMPDTDL
jgi:hypothetical protein